MTIKELLANPALLESLLEQDCSPNDLESFISCMIKETIRQLYPDPAVIISADEHLELMMSFFDYADKGLIPPQRLNALWANSFLSGAPRGSRQEFRQFMQHVALRQDELLFITNGANISASPLSYGFPAHWHKNSYFDIAYVFAGSARFFFRDETLDLTPSDFLIVPPEIEHGECLLNEESKALTCAIRKSAFVQLFMPLFNDNVFLHSFLFRILNGEESIPYLLFHTWPDEPRLSQRDMHSDVPYGYTETDTSHSGADTDFPDSRLDSLFSDLMKEQFSDGAYRNKMSDALMSMIFVRLLRYHEQKLVLPASAGFHWKPEYDEIFRYISAHYTTVSLEELSSRFHYSRRQLMRIVQDCTGKNFSALMQDMKMQLAKTLLTETHLPVEEISARCGYENFSSFCRVFSRHTGSTPSQYRRRNLD